MKSILNKIGKNKTRCEDAFLFKEEGDFIYGGVFDGCSTGINSSWASQTLVYIYNQLDVEEFLENYLKVGKTLMYFCNVLSINEMNLLATCVLFRYNKFTNTLETRCFGDGVFIVNDEITIIDQNNTPDYLAYHIGNVQSLTDFYEQYPIQTYENVYKFSICSDGILSFALPQTKTSELVPLSFLSNDIQSENHLVRKFNILHKQGWEIHDDLTIIYVDTK